MHTIKLTIAFDGTNYSGWQRQKNANTIQEEIEKQLSRIHSSPITLHGAGRTDAGVHAKGMVAHFHSAKAISTTAFFNSLNSMLPPSIRILQVEKMDNGFHARFSVKSKTYIYTLCIAPIQLPTQRLYSVHIRKPLDTLAMQDCLKIIIGTLDFSSFETAGSRDKSIVEGRGAVRTIFQAELQLKNDTEIQFFFTGDGFLRHMIRNLMGTILDVGLGRKSVTRFEEILLARDRQLSSSTAPAKGLILQNVNY